MLDHQRTPCIRGDSAVVGAIAKQQWLKIIVSGLLVSGTATLGFRSQRAPPAIRRDEDASHSSPVLQQRGIGAFKVENHSVPLQHL
jgi:hypothetical protein